MLKLASVATSVVALSAAALVTPAVAQNDCDGLERPIVFAGLDWDSNAFHTSVAQFIFEHGYGCEVDQIPGSTIPLLNGMIRGDIDVTMEVWIPNVKDAWDEAVADGAVEALGTGMDAVQGWFVPTYLTEGEDAPAPDLASVDDLEQYAELFRDPEEPEKGRFYNCILGWGCEVMNTKKLAAYGLLDSYTNFRPGTGGALASAIESAILREQPIVFYYWGPTWILGKVGDQVTMLDEPAYDEEIWSELSAMEASEVTEDTPATAYPIVDVQVSANTDFIGQAPSLVEYLSKHSIPGDAVSAALAYAQDEGASIDETAEWWLRNNEDVWTAWVPQDVADRVKSALGSA